MTELDRVVHKTMGDILSLGYEDFAIVVNVKDGPVGIQLAFASTKDAMDRVDTDHYNRVGIAVVHPDDAVTVSEKSDDKDGD